MLLGMFEQDLPDHIICRYPQLYKRMQKGALLTPVIFFCTLASAVWHSLGEYYI